MAHRLVSLLAAVLALGATADSAGPATSSPLDDARAAEDALAEGRVHLAHTIAARALERHDRRDVVLHARLLRVEIMAVAEADDLGGSAPLRDLLRRTEHQRPSTLERALDAGLDMALALHQERRGGPSALAPATRVVDLSAELDDEGLAPLTASLCRAAAYVARRGPPTVAPRADQVLARASTLAAASVVPRAKCLIALGDRARSRKESDAADARYDEALALLGDRPALRERREIWFSKALLAEDRGAIGEAFVRAKRAARAVDELLARETDLDAREALLTGTLGYYGSAERLGLDAGEVKAAVAVAEHGKGRALAAVLSRASTIDATPGGHALRDGGAAEPPPFEDGDVLDALSSSLRADEAAISYTMLPADPAGKLTIAIGVVTREGVAAVRVDRPSTLTKDVASLREAVQRNDEAAAFVIGSRIHAVLVAPIESQLRGKTRLLVSPHLSLHGLPWAALHDGAHPLVARFVVARIPPLVLARPPARQRAGEGRPARWLSVFDPLHEGMTPLPALAALGDDVDARIGPMTTLRGSDATRDRMQKELSHADALVYGGHARYEPTDPLRSALLLAGAPGRDDELRAEAVLRLDRPLDVVVLVGCETARQWNERPSYGDETIGLPRAFLAAGARSVVGTMWSVADRDAEDFVHALPLPDTADDAPAAVRAAQACLAEKRCRGRGIVTWASWIVDAR